MPTIDCGHGNGRRNQTACPTLLDQSFGEVGGAGGFACLWKLISNRSSKSRKRLCTRCGGQSWLSGWACGPPIVMKTNPLTVHSRDRMRNRFSTVQPPFEAARRSTERDLVCYKAETSLT